jgi:hypothetical protein
LVQAVLEHLYLNQVALQVVTLYLELLPQMVAELELDTKLTQVTLAMVLVVVVVVLMKQLELLQVAVHTETLGEVVVLHKVRAEAEAELVAQEPQQADLMAAMVEQVLLPL